MKNFLRKILGQKLINYYHLAGAILANLFYGFPSRKLHIIGVTGTDGKTTTVNLIVSILKAAGLTVSFLSTINTQIGKQTFDTGLHTTTPSPFLLQRLLAKMVHSGSKYAVLEITSHALDQYRTWGIRFETAILTNITHEHLDYHKTYEEYREAKAKLFRGAANLVLNRDDPSYEVLAALPGRKTTYGLSSASQVWASNIVENLQDTQFLVHTSRGEQLLTFNLPGQFNVRNALAAIAAALNYEIALEVIARGLEKVRSVAGRLEFIKAGQDFLVLVDFAHTPNGLRELLSFLRPKVAGRIIAAFGAAGERDQTKRPLMGAVADEFADIVVLTREDNRSERVEGICQEIASGVKNKALNQNLFIIPDRREAIRFALKQAKTGDLVAVTGKGHEQSLNVDGEEVPWDDRRVVWGELQKLVVSK